MEANPEEGEGAQWERASGSQQKEEGLHFSVRHHRVSTKVGKVGSNVQGGTDDERPAHKRRGHVGD